MKQQSSPISLRKCPYSQCLEIISKATPGLNSGQIVRKGFYRRRSDSKNIRRYFCTNCKRSFSAATKSNCFRQKKRNLNTPIRELLSSGISQRRAAMYFKINRKTVVRKFLFAALQSKKLNQAFLDGVIGSGKKFSHVQFDEMESFERSKCLPLSIPLVVEARTRRILAFDVCVMPAKGLLARISRKKYGQRADHRPESVSEMFRKLTPILAANVTIESDQKPMYPAWINPHFPRAHHIAHKGRRGCIVGQGELKKIGFDPLFDLNHTCAMIRANINRLFRRTWCTTKQADRLRAHLEIYVRFHNERIIGHQH